MYQWEKVTPECYTVADCCGFLWAPSWGGASRAVFAGTHLGEHFDTEPSPGKSL